MPFQVNTRYPYVLVTRIKIYLYNRGCVAAKNAHDINDLRYFDLVLEVSFSGNISIKPVLDMWSITVRLF